MLLISLFYKLPSLSDKDNVKEANGCYVQCYAMHSDSFTLFTYLCVLPKTLQFWGVLPKTLHFKNSSHVL
jgi:hypothetical protein